MKTIAALLFISVAAHAAEPVKLPVRACLKWSKDIPQAQAAGAGLFASVARVEGAGPFADCDVVIVTETFGVGWLMSAYMKEGVFSPCGKRLGGYNFRYKRDQWQEKLIAGLHRFLIKHPAALSAAQDCPAAPVPGATATMGMTISTPVQVSSAPAVVP